MKKWVSAITAAVMAFCTLSATAVHAEPIEEEPVTEIVIEDYLYTNDIYGNVTINGSTVTCKSVVIGKSNVTRIEVTQTLQGKIPFFWVPMGEWTDSVNGNRITVTNSVDGAIYGTFRVKTVAKVYSGSNYETLTEISPSVTF